MQQVVQVIEELLSQGLIQAKALLQHGLRRRITRLFTGKRAARYGVHGKKGNSRNNENGQ